MNRTLAGRRKLLWLWNERDGQCPRCRLPITGKSRWHFHHIELAVPWGSDRLTSLLLVHENCHRQIHSHGKEQAKPPVS